MNRTWVCVAAIFLLGGCATPGPGDTVAPIGEAPTAAAAEKAVLDRLRVTLKDPDSMKQFRVTGGPIPFTWYRGLLFGGGYDQAWLVCFEYNAKNSYGAYTGLASDGVALRGAGEFAYAITDVNWGTASRRCN